MSVPKAKFEKKLEEILKGRGIPEERMPIETVRAECKIGKIKKRFKGSIFDSLIGYAGATCFFAGAAALESPHPFNLLSIALYGTGLYTIYDTIKHRDKIILDQDKIDQPYNPKNVAEQASEYIKE